MSFNNRHKCHYHLPLDTGLLQLNCHMKTLFYTIHLPHYCCQPSVLVSVCDSVIVAYFLEVTHVRVLLLTHTHYYYLFCCFYSVVFFCFNVTIVICYCTLYFILQLAYTK